MLVIYTDAIDKRLFIGEMFDSGDVQLMEPNSNFELLLLAVLLLILFAACECSCIETIHKKASAQ